MPWFAVRSLYHCGQKSGGANLYEERIVCFEAPTADAAHHAAKIESEAYAATRGFTAFLERMSYEQDGEALVNGYELWSALFQSTLSLTEFYNARYAQYDYEPG